MVIGDFCKLIVSFEGRAVGYTLFSESMSEGRWKHVR